MRLLELALGVHLSEKDHTDFPTVTARSHHVNPISIAATGHYRVLSISEPETDAFFNPHQRATHATLD